jgi:hypothetical protein
VRIRTAKPIDRADYIADVFSLYHGHGHPECPYTISFNEDGGNLWVYHTVGNDLLMVDVLSWRPIQLDREVKAWVDRSHRFTMAQAKALWREAVVG